MYQKLTLIGNLGQDPEMRYLSNGQAVTNFSLACNRRWNDSTTGETQEEVTWFRISVWGRQAEAVNQYLSKGRQVLVIGRLRPDSTTGSPRLFTRNDGSIGASFEVVAERVQFLGGNANGHSNGSASVAETVYEADDIPF